MSMALITGIGVAGYMYLKKKNPNMINDMKQMIQNMTSNMSSKLDDIDM